MHVQTHLWRLMYVQTHACAIKARVHQKERGYGQLEVNVNERRDTARNQSFNKSQSRQEEQM